MLAISQDMLLSRHKWTFIHTRRTVGLRLCDGTVERRRRKRVARGDHTVAHLLSRRKVVERHWWRPMGLRVWLSVCLPV